tara:strand:+ start:2694 stop:3167 length:474 start_codon:yes stop_codon:yes gene_type:complete
MAEKKFGVREINVIDLTGTPTIESTGTLNINAGSGSDVNINTDLNVSGVVSDSAGSLRNLPQVSKSSAYTLIASDTGKHVSISSGGVTVASGVFSIGDVVTIYNNSSSSQTITQGTSVTLRQAGTSNTGNRSLASYGVATLMCVASNTFVISGVGLS